MPRYCAAICCKNRRGRNNKDRKLSFYPFPLHDKERLEKWLKNMKRDSWVPSKYQFLCSDHFTPDSLDIRWGIRYLKQTAIPTIFSLPEDCQEKDTSKKKAPKKKLGDERETCLKDKSEELFLSNEAKKNIVNIQVLPQHAELHDSPAMVKPPAAKSGMMQNNMLTPDLLKQDTENPESTLVASIHQDVGVSGFFTTSTNLSSTTITLTTSNSEGIITSHLTNPNFINNSVEIMSAQENPFFFSPAEELNTNKESVIAIFIPTENSKPAVNLFIPAPKVAIEDTDIEDSFCKDVDRDAEVLQIEHSYCRQDVNREHLWQKVSKLHSKVTLLELQEQQTLGRLRSLEALVSQLKQENWLSEETVKIIENHFTTYEVTML